jgi:vacuolar protein-sorting-associated protein 4
MSNTFTDQGIAVVKEAIQADNDQDYEKALMLYKRALEVFMTGVKYEKNETSKQMILKRVEGYMKRAEDLKDVLRQQHKPKPSTGGTGERDKRDGEPDDETSKLQGQLSSAIMTDKPNVKWADVAGLEGAKEALKEAVILPRRFPQLFVGKRRPWRGILLFGPPGTGKSYLAKAVATEADAKFFAVSSSDLVSKWQGESERLVKNLFAMARQEEHAIIFVDEIDSLCGSRSEGESDATRRIKTEFLVQMQGVQQAKDGLLVLGATNIPWDLDPAIRRRFEKRIYIPLPEAPARSTMLKNHLGNTPNQLEQGDFDRIGRECDGMSGSDLSIVCREAIMEPMRTCQKARQFRPVMVDHTEMLAPCETYPSCAYCPIDLSDAPASSDPCQYCGSIRMTMYDMPSPELMLPPVVSAADFERSLERIKKTVAEEELGQFISWAEKFGQEG